MNLALVNSQRTLLSISKTTIQVEARRWRCVRKPIWLPVGPTKLYRIPQHPPKLPNEARTRVALDNIYTTRIYSIKQYFYKEFYEPTTIARGFSQEQVDAEEEEQKRLLEENEILNQQIAATRIQRHEEELQELEQQLMERHIQLEEDLKQRVTQIDEDVRREKERSKTYITLETLESAIVEALENPVSYEYAIDIKGNILCDANGGKLHPYALRPSAIPDTSSNVEEWKNIEPNAKINLAVFNSPKNPKTADQRESSSP